MTGRREGAWLGALAAALLGGASLACQSGKVDCQPAFAFAPALPAGPRSNATYTYTPHERRCAASARVGTVAVEKTAQFTDVSSVVKAPGPGSGEVHVDLLVQEGGAWQRHTLEALDCGSFNGCVSEGAFRVRRFDVERDGDRVAVVEQAGGSFQREAWIVYLAGKKAPVVRATGAAETAREVLGREPKAP